MIIEKNKVRKIELLGGSCKTTAQQIFDSLKEKPDYLINAGMFDMHSGITVCDTIVDGKLINGGNYTNRGFAIGNTLTPCTTEEAIKNKEQYFLGGSPAIIWDSKIDMETKGLTNWFLNTGKSYRIGIGINKDGNIIVQYPNEKITVKALAEGMLKLGCTYAINLDGGGSTRVMKNENCVLKALNNPTENRAVSTWLAVYMEKENKKPKVCIDAGHAKNTLGKRSFDGKLLEYEFNRDVAKRLKDILERHNVECVYSCNIDIAYDTPTATRASNANATNADLFVSIHANAYGETWSNANGWEIYVCKKGGNAEKVAKHIQEESIPYLGIKNRGIKEESFEVLVKTNMSAVLIEHGFYTNKEECALLLTNDFREKCAIADAKGILKYFGIDFVDKPVDNVDIPSDWANDSWEWAKKNGICDGTRPKETATREEIVVMLHRLWKM